jgi:endonuclease/exonuclease/phosphatase family metal-dependent hydrolase
MPSTSLKHMPHSDRADELRVLHWNIHSWQDDAGGPNVDAVADLIQESDAHVVSLVEVDETWNRPSTLDQVAARTGHASVFVPTFEFGDDGPLGGFGNALLSKLPIRAVRQRQLLWPPQIYDGTEPSEPRSVTLAKLEAASGTVWIGNAHLPRRDQNARADALQRLTTIVDELAEPWLLVGDFNAPVESWLDRRSSLQSYLQPIEPTYPAQNPVEAIDYCVAPSGLNISVNILNNIGSDHLPILVRCWGISVDSLTPIECDRPAGN